jgi:hypothetical protein
MRELLPVDHNVVMPDSCRGTGLKKYPWRTMGVSSGRPLRGDSFLVPCPIDDMRELVRIENSLTSCIRWMRKRYAMQFAMRRMDDGVRVWRLK